MPQRKYIRIPVSPELLRAASELAPAEESTAVGILEGVCADALTIWKGKADRARQKLDDDAEIDRLEAESTAAITAGEERDARLAELKGDAG